ncbi:hypothetical protein BH23CHL2_BH23CHL2_03510 [soil metagenome]
MNTSSSIPHDGHIQIFGRDRERSGLGALLDQARDGNGSIVLVGGQADIGKTTLVRDLERRAIDRGMITLTGYCYDLTVTPPYSPWAQIARASARVAGLPLPPTAFQDEDALKRSASKETLFQEIERFLVSITDLHPLVLILEDLHWSDRESLEFLRWFGHQLSHLRILVVVTYRNNELTRQHALYEMLPVLVRETPAQRIHLRPLDDPAVSELVTDRYQLPADGSAKLVSYLRERAEGNPFFLGELLSALEEEGRIYPTDGGGWVVADLEHLPVPPLVRQVIDSRLNRLGDDARRPLEVASVIGQDVPFALWSAVDGLQDGDLVSVAERALDAHLLVGSGDGETLRFPHALIREALYEGLLPPRRRMLHGRVAEALMASPGVAPDTIAHHLQEAGDPRAIDWFVQAGIRAERVAWLTAAEHFTSALQLMREHDVDLSERGWLIIRLVRLVRWADQPLCRAHLEEALEYARETGDSILRAYATFCRGEVRFYQGEGTAGMADKEAGLAILHDLSPSDRQRLAELINAGVIVSDIVLSATSAAGQGHQGATQKALDAATQVVIEAEARGASIPAEAPWAVGLAKALRGDPITARQAFARARERFRAGHDYSMAGSVANMELIMTVLPYQTDNLAERARILSEGEREWILARGAQGAFSPDTIRLSVMVLEGEWGVAHRQLLAIQTMPMVMARKHIFTSLLAQMAHAQGDTDLAWRLVTGIMRDGPATSPGNTQIIAGLNLLGAAAALALDEGNLDGACAWLQAYDRWLDWSDALLKRADNQLLWATYHHADGDPVAAYAAAKHALQLATEPRQPLALLRAHRLLGELETSGGQIDSARHHLQESLRLADACNALYERALTLLALAELGVATGEENAAWLHLDRARAICTRLGAEPALQRAAEVAAQLSTRRGKRVHPAGLTPREVEVLQLVADGLTDAEVAERLFVSPRTVNSHLTSVYNKLGVNSRVEAARFAVEQGLTGRTSQSST